MAHGGPDWGTEGPLGTIYTIQDMGELAARLGSIVTFDRRGNVVFIDGFESGLAKWYQEASGTGAAIAASAAAARNGTLSVKLTTGDAQYDYAWIIHYCPYPTTSKVGFEISFTSTNNLFQFVVAQRLYDGIYEHYPQLRYLPITDVLQYSDSDGNWQDLATSINLGESQYKFHTVKLVVDLSTQKYVRAILDDVEYDMSALSYKYTASGNAPLWEQFVLIHTDVDDNESIYVDDAIVTQNEP